MLDLDCANQPTDFVVEVALAQMLWLMLRCCEELLLARLLELQAQTKKLSLRLTVTKRGRQSAQQNLTAAGLDLACKGHQSAHEKLYLQQGRQSVQHELAA